MMGTKSLVSLLVFLGSLLSISAEAKRAAPAVVKPLQRAGVSYSYIIEPIQTGCSRVSKQCGAKVSMTATSVKDKKIRWKTEIYQTRYDDKLEVDVQSVYPRSLKFKHREWVELINERGHRFIINKYGGSMYWPAAPRVYRGPVSKAI